MSDDLVIRLRDLGPPNSGYQYIAREAAHEIERVREAKRRALQVADERSKENVELRAELARIRQVIVQIKDVCDDNLCLDNNATAIALRFVGNVAAKGDWWWNREWQRRCDEAYKRYRSERT